MAGATLFMANATIHLHKHDLPEGLSLGPVLAVDTEAMGLDSRRDRLCLVQMSAGDGIVHLVQIIPPELGGRGADCPNLKRLLSDPAVVKLMHFARFDVGLLQHALGIRVAPVRCTKIAAKLVRTYTDRHGLKDVTKELLGIELSKEQQSSDWAAAKLSAAQTRYAAADVLNLHAIRERLNVMLVREGRAELAERCFEFIGTRAELDLAGWADTDIFSH